MIPRRRGYTVILAVTMLGLVAVAATMIVHQLGYELQRTRTTYEDAQLRQLLLAAAQDIAAREESSDSVGKGKPRELELPESLKQQGESVSIAVVDAGTPAEGIRIIARFNQREATETLHFDRDAKRWTVLEPAE
jgi:hypothetical protein